MVTIPFKKEYICYNDVSYGVMENLKMNIDSFIRAAELKETHVGLWSYISFFNKNKKPSTPIYIDYFNRDLWYIKLISRNNTFDKYIDKINYERVLAYNKKFESFIDNLEKYIIYNVDHGVFFGQMVFDFKRVVEYKRLAGYSVSEYCDLLYLFKEFQDSLNN